MGEFGKALAQQGVLLPLRSAQGSGSGCPCWAVILSRATGQLTWNQAALQRGGDNQPCAVADEIPTTRMLWCFPPFAPCTTNDSAATQYSIAMATV